MNQADNKPIFLIGSGGHASVLEEIISLTDKKLLGILDPNRKPGEKCLNSVVLGGDELIDEYLPEDISLVNGVGTLPGNNKRTEISKKYREKGFSFSTLIHPSAVLSSEVEIEEGVQIMAGATIQRNVKIGKDSIINTNSSVDHDCLVGESVHISPGVTLGANVIIGNCSHICLGSSLIQNIKIGKDSIVAAGSVIFEDIPENTKYIPLVKSNLKEL